MRQKIKAFLMALATISIFSPKHVRAGESINFPEKEIKLNLVLQKYNSPLQGHEKELITYAEKYHLDWALLAAIAGTESSFGKRMPYQCLNPFGWGIYGQNRLCFDSFSQTIQTVAQGIGTKYNTTNLETIARTYNPVNTQHWLRLTRKFLYQIKNRPIPASKLPITL